MSATDDLTFTRALLSPEPKADYVGVGIAIGYVPSQGNVHNVWLHGTYQIPHNDAVLIKAQPLQKALIITVISGEQNFTQNLVGNTVLFDDDEIFINAMHKGYFNVNLTEWLKASEKREYFIMISLGSHVSNSLQVVMNPTPFQRQR